MSNFLSAGNSYMATAPQPLQSSLFFILFIYLICKAAGFTQKQAKEKLPISGNSWCMIELKTCSGGQQAT